ncbi:hypothetical protein DUI87_08381 [Hirundo rustica rustica]|uniref:Uncharacterized protein n=1 Tax=Hirundo rustica rustica TaxID=333673 RepID=A0A3M0LA96_HIRRU|nr:hypothetical protein DUI87_08381 [Hirundo rustica rustica]
MLGLGRMKRSIKKGMSVRHEDIEDCGVGDRNKEEAQKLIESKSMKLWVLADPPNKECSHADCVLLNAVLTQIYQMNDMAFSILLKFPMSLLNMSTGLNKILVELVDVTVFCKSLCFCHGRVIADFIPCRIAVQHPLSITYEEYRNALVVCSFYPDWQSTPSQGCKWIGSSAFCKALCQRGTDDGKLVSLNHL